MNDKIHYCYQDCCETVDRSVINEKLREESLEGDLWRKAEKLMSYDDDEFPDAVLVMGGGELEIWFPKKLIP